MIAKSYASPAAFKQALEKRLKTRSSDGLDFGRRRQLLVFDRFLARVSQFLGDAVILKGGLVLEFRLGRARTTKDVDLRIIGRPRDVLESLQEAGRLDLGDFVRFEVQVDPQHPTIDGAAIKYEGYRFRVLCLLAGKVYGRPFGVDVAFGDPIACEPDLVIAPDLLDFAGIAPPTLRLYPVVTHIAEKLHAYTIPRERPNSRVKDLPDIALLAGAGNLDSQLLRSALRQTFSFRGTHELPEALPAPPAFWNAPYEAIARADTLEWLTLDVLHTAAASFIDPLLSDVSLGSWDPEHWSWQKL